MRNGNVPVQVMRVAKALGSYPTYEEWKRVYFDFIKHTFGSYPTYEEWKPFFHLLFNFFFPFVLILPMRNGNLDILLGYKMI